CLMEGISHEACSLAGTLGLGKLTAFYDDNGISIDGPVQGWFTDDTPKRFEAYGWHVVRDVDGHDAASIEAALKAARAIADRPSLICCKTTIGKGAPTRAGTAKAHGEALGPDEVAATRAALGWDHPAFEIPKSVYSEWDRRPQGAAAQQDWDARFAAYASAHPNLASEFKRRMAGELPVNFAAAVAAAVEAANAKGETVATRKASQLALTQLAPLLPELIGGSADLMGSVFTNWPGSKVVSRSAAGNIVNFGVREFAMAAITNGMALHGGYVPETGTFLTFSDYSRNALRMAALMKLRNIFVFTHDSIGLGEDGPTHQAIEHTASLRLIPNMAVWRPCDTVETAVAWGAALQRRGGPTAFILSRQNVAFQKRDSNQTAAIARGGYVLAEAQGGKPRAVIIATGSEVPLAMGAREQLQKEGIAVRVVSMPCTSLFDAQDAAYRASVLPPGVPRVAVEAGVTDGWRKYVGAVDSKSGAVVGIDRFGESAPAGALFKFFGFTVENVVSAVKGLQ
ncbi:MAG TPA: transketolase, partial [Burkholderiales bacterium]|nr:transketolase [Burkholderiales bacterium]